MKYQKWVPGLIFKCPVLLNQQFKPQTYSVYNKIKQRIAAARKELNLLQPLHMELKGAIFLIMLAVGMHRSTFFHLQSIPIHEFGYLLIPILFRYQNSVCFNIIIIIVDFIWGWNELLSVGKYDIEQTSEVQISVVKLRTRTPFSFSANLVDTQLYSSDSAVFNKYLLDGKLNQSRSDYWRLFSSFCPPAKNSGLVLFHMVLFKIF